MKTFMVSSPTPQMNLILLAEDIGAFQFGNLKEYPIRIDDELKTRFNFMKIGSAQVM